MSGIVCIIDHNILFTSKPLSEEINITQQIICYFLYLQYHVLITHTCFINTEMVYFLSFIHLLFFLRQRIKAKTGYVRVFCHTASGPPPLKRSPRTIRSRMIGPPGPSVALYVVPQGTIRGTISGPPLPCMVQPQTPQIY